MQIVFLQMFLTVHRIDGYRGRLIVAEFDKVLLSSDEIEVSQRAGDLGGLVQVDGTLLADQA